MFDKIKQTARRVMRRQAKLDVREAVRKARERDVLGSTPRPSGEKTCSCGAQLFPIWATTSDRYLYCFECRHLEPAKGATKQGSAEQVAALLCDVADWFELDEQTLVVTTLEVDGKGLAVDLATGRSSVLTTPEAVLRRIAEELRGIGLTSSALPRSSRPTG